MINLYKYLAYSVIYIIVDLIMFLITIKTKGYLSLTYFVPLNENFKYLTAINEN